MIRTKLDELDELQSAIVGLAEIQQEIDISHECEGRLPDWWNQRHSGGLIAAVRLLSKHSHELIEELQEQRQGGDA